MLHQRFDSRLCAGAELEVIHHRPSLIDLVGKARVAEAGGASRSNAGISSITRTDFAVTVIALVLVRLLASGVRLAH